MSNRLDLSWNLKECSISDILSVFVYNFLLLFYVKQYVHVNYRQITHLYLIYLIETF